LLSGVRFLTEALTFIAYQFIEDENSTLEKVSGRLTRTENPFKNDFKLRLSGIKEVI